MKTYKIFTIAALSAAAVSCSSDFLETSPIMSEVATQFYKSDDDMFAALIAAYDALQLNAKEPMGHFIPYGEIQSDNASVGGGSTADGGTLQYMESFRGDDVNPYSEHQWTYAYKQLNRANLVINAPYTSDVTEVYKAEAKVIRAWVHFNTMRRFGPCVIATESEYPNDYPFVRSTREEVDAQIEKDLTEAIPLLEEKFGSDMTGRITKGTAQAIMGMHLMYKADWDNDNKATFSEAIPYLEAVINSGNYQLCNYDDLWTVENDNSPESIFEFQRTSMSGHTNWGTTDDSEGTFWVQFVGPRGVGSTHNIYFQGYGFCNPSMDLYNYYLEEDSVRRSWCGLSYEEFVSYVNSDGSTPSWDTTTHNPEDFEGMVQKKYCTRNTPFLGSQALNNSANERVIRLSNVYLYLAEAYLRGEGNEAKAVELIETLRAKHVPGGMTVAELQAYDPARFATVLDVIWYERRCELAGEGDRWYDLVRTGRAEDVMVEFCANGKMHGKVDVVWKNTNNYMPIGSIETTTCPSLTTFPDEAYK